MSEAELRITENLGKGGEGVIGKEVMGRRRKGMAGEGVSYGRIGWEREAIGGNRLKVRR